MFVLTKFNIHEDNDNLAATFDVQMENVCLHGITLARLHADRTKVFVRVPKLQLSGKDAPVCTIDLRVYAEVKARAIQRYNEMASNGSVYPCTREERRDGTVDRIDGHGSKDIGSLHFMTRAGTSQ